MKVFKNKFGNWNTLFKNKLLNGEEIKYYMPVQFQKGQEPLKESIDINPLRWWGSCYLGKVDHNGTEEQVPKPKLFIADWEEILPEQTEVDKSIEQFKAQNYAEYKAETEPKKEETGLNIKADDLPFY